MAYVLKPSDHVGRDIRRAARERLDKAAGHLESLVAGPPDRAEELVHEFRKRSKEARALARLVRPALGPEFGRFNALVGGAAAELSSLRDAHAVLATLDELAGANDADDPAFAHVRAVQAARAGEAAGGLGVDDPRIAAALQMIGEARAAIGQWKLPGGFAPIAAGLGDTYRAGRRSSERAQRSPSDDHVHEWRKAVKHLWYQVRLLTPAAPSVLGALAGSLDDLADALGDDHDLAVLVEMLDADADRFGGGDVVATVTRAARLRQDELRRRAYRLAATVYAESPKRFVERMTAYWELRLEGGPELKTGGIAAISGDDPLGARGRPLPGDRAVDGLDGLDGQVGRVAEHRSTVELERKYLLTEPVELPPGTLLRQGYIAADGAVNVRLRDAGPDGCSMTIKAGSGAARIEVELPIDRLLLEQLWEHIAGREVAKTRSRVALGAQTAEVDTYHGQLDGLVVAEVEFDDHEAMARFTPPDWFGPEVTDDDRYTNATLARSGLDAALFRHPSPS